MINIPAARMQAAQELGDFLTSDAGRETLARNNFVSGTPMFPADANETVVSVVSRLRQDDGDAAIVAVHFASKPQRLVFVTIAEESPSETLEDDDRMPTGGDATIGMLADYLIKARRKLAVSVSRHVSAGAFEPMAA